MTKFPLTITILTKNSRLYLKEVLSALKDFDEIVICDTGSTDDTLSLAGFFPNVKIYERPFIGFGPTHNVASTLASHDWIFSLDSDEIISPELLVELHTLILKQGLQRGKVYSLPRHNEYKGKWIKGCGWYPDYQSRIYNRLDTSFNKAQVHESIITQNMEVVRLKNPIRHYSYSCSADFINKMQSYSDLFAQQNQGKHSSSIGKAISHGFFAFIKSYILKRGFLLGSQGFEISFYNASTAFYKYMKLDELNKKKQT